MRQLDNLRKSRLQCLCENYKIFAGHSFSHDINAVKSPRLHSLRKNAQLVIPQAPFAGGICFFLNNCAKSRSPPAAGRPRFARDDSYCPFSASSSAAEVRILRLPYRLECSTPNPTSERNPMNRRMPLQRPSDGVNYSKSYGGERSSAGRASGCGFAAFRDPDDSSTLSAHESRIYHRFITREPISKWPYFGIA